MAGKKIILYFLLFIISSALFFSLQPFGRPGGDSTEIALFAQSTGFMYYYRSPLTVFLHQAAFKFLSQWGLSIQNVIGICSSIAGGFFVIALFSFSRNFWFLLLNLSSGVIMIFWGHVEHYAWVNMILAFYFLSAKKYLEDRKYLLMPVILFFTACLFHMLAVFYLPTLLFLFLNPTRENNKLKFALPNKKQIEKIIIAAILFMLVIALGPVILHPRGLDNNTSRLVPLFSNPNPTRYFFTMFSITHFEYCAYFLMMASPLGLFLLAAQLGKIKTRFHYIMLLAICCGFFWEFIWHPDMGKADWDLFSNFAIPLNILAGLLLTEKNKKEGSENEA